MVDVEKEVVVETEYLPSDPRMQLLELLESNMPAGGFPAKLRLRDRLGRQVPATRDPHILQRREMAMPLWNSGWTAQEVRAEVNRWLQSEEKPPVSIETIRADHKAIFQDWETDYEHSSAENRAMHIAALNRMKSEAMRTYEVLRLEGKQGGGSAAAYLKIAMQAEVELATLDGSRKRAEIQAERESDPNLGQTIVRIYEGVNLEKV